MSPLKRIVIIDLAGPHTHTDSVERNLTEVRELVATYGAVDVRRIIQHRTAPDKATFIGSGKVDELTAYVKAERIDIVIVNAIVNHGQLFHLTKQLWKGNPLIEVWDRVELILHIFEKHARTAEAKAQIEIARMHHMGPRMYGLGGTFFSRQGGGVGNRGEGETNIELMKRHWKTQIKKKEDNLAHLTQTRMQQLERRKERGLKTISIVGYTNAGKTSLFNLLTHKKQIVRDALFVTLDATTGSVYIPLLGEKAIFSDTIGFIRDLPPSLVKAFTSTLLESVHADIILHVIDVADPERRKHIDTVNEILHEVGVHATLQLYVFNKIDLLPEKREQVIARLQTEYVSHTPLFISAREKEGVQTLLNTIARHYSPSSTRTESAAMISE